MDISYDEAKTLKTISAQRVGLFNIGPGRVLPKLEKIPGNGSGRSVDIRSNIFGYLF